MSAAIAILGQGAWGRALAQTWRTAGNDVITWDRHTADRTLRDADLIVTAVPAQATRTMLLRVSSSLKPDATVLVTAKGLEQGTLARQSQIVAVMAPGHPCAALSGPGFAADLTQGLPTALTLAAPFEQAEGLQARLATDALRLYLTDDLVGTELGGALKNVIAIACGVTIGAGLGESARAALIARGFAEISRLAVSCGAQAETLGGLSGLGDLTLTCTSDQSRNYRFGAVLGQTGQAPSGETYEGASTADAASALAQRQGIDAPVITATAALVGGHITVQEAIQMLMRRPLRRE